MSDEKRPAGPETAPPAEHEERVNKAFDSLHEELGDRLDDEHRASIDALREAAVQRDTEAGREKLSEVRERHGWLYEELAKHPEVAALIDELALWGF
jgi:hypothetical protein